MRGKAANPGRSNVLAGGAHRREHGWFAADIAHHGSRLLGDAAGRSGRAGPRQSEPVRPSAVLPRLVHDRFADVEEHRLDHEPRLLPVWKPIATASCAECSAATSVRTERQSWHIRPAQTLRTVGGRTSAGADGPSRSSTIGLSTQDHAVDRCHRKALTSASGRGVLESRSPCGGLVRRAI
jgi:hypothetical protein